MPFNLTGVIREKIITELFIPQVRNALVSRNFVVEKSAINATSIKVYGVGTVVITDYTGGTVTPTAHVDTFVLLTLDKAKDFNQSVEKIDSSESALDIFPGIIEAGSYGLASAIDVDVFSMLAATTEVVADPVLDSTNIVEWMGNLSTKLTNNGAPKQGRKLGFTPEMVNILNQANVTLNTSTAEAAAVEGNIGRFLGFDILESVNLPVFSETFATLNVTAIPSVGTTIVENPGGSVVSGTAELVGTVLNVFDATDLAIAAAAQATAAAKVALAVSPRGAALGLGFNDLDIENIPGQHFAVAKGLISYGTKLVKGEYIVKSAPTFA